MALNDDQLQAILLEQSYVTQEDIDKARKDMEERTITLKQSLMELELLTDSLYENAIAEYYNLPYFDNTTTTVNPSIVEDLPEAISRAYSCAVVARPDVNTVTIITSDPGRDNLEEAIRSNLDQKEAVFPVEKKKDGKEEVKVVKKGEQRVSFGGEITLLYSPQGVIDSLQVHYRKPLDTKFQVIINESKKVAPEILQTIFDDAINLGASDIHFEPRENEVMIRFRVDGVLHVAGQMPKIYYEGVLNRIKIAGNMKIDKHYEAQDGAIRYRPQGSGKVDMRVSILPLVDGEKVVMRIISDGIQKLTLQTLGFSDRHRRQLERAANKPFGMILASGPTGSGKSTTLYSLIKLRNRPDVNISTIEDPVEYKIAGVNHTQKNDETNLTFSNGLRALMRQDPDIMLVGEIRDNETAEIAVNSALTGHLLFSTVHANTAATAIPRLLEMGVEPFLLASTLEVVIGQRLLRRICNKCRYSYKIPGNEVQNAYPLVQHYFNPEETYRLFKGKGCIKCHNTGYSGRMGIHELFVFSTEIKEMIIERRPTADLTMKAREQGMKLMFEDGLDKMLQGFTTMEELIRVAAPPRKRVEVLEDIES
jgi:type IV pilus assembly protein PilB